MEEKGGPNTKEKARAVVRIALGTAQVMAATVILVLLIETGASSLTVVATVITLLLVVVSRTLFRKEN